jgi:hypothetical protein
MRLLLLSVAILVASAAPATAQYPDVVIYCCAGLSGAYDGTSVQLRVQLHASSVTEARRINDVVGLDVYRITGGSGPCGERVRVTATPIPWTQADVLDHAFTDSGVEPNRLYSYHVEAVDAQRGFIDLRWGWGYSIACWVRTGDVPIGHGVLETVAQPSVDPCPLECYGLGGDVILPPELRSYVDSHIPLFLYGPNLDCCGHPQFGTAAVITSARRSTCIVAVQPATWGLVKQLYRD